MRSAVSISISWPLAVGQVLLLKGLVSRTDLEGSRGVVVSYDATTERYAFKLDATGETVKVKHSNLRCADGVSQGYACVNAQVRMGTND